MKRGFLYLLQNHQRLIYLILPLLVFLCFINSIRNGFVYDDLFLIIRAEPAIQDWSVANLKSLVTSDFWTFITKHLDESQKAHSIQYRPALLVSFMVFYLFTGISSWKWHLLSILLHALASVLAYKVVLNTLVEAKEGENNLSKSKFLALITASIFAIHPVQSESVAWVSAYANSLIAILMFTALLAYLQARKQSSFNKYFWLFISAFFYLLALFTKEPGIVLIAILVSYETVVFDKEASLFNRLTRAFFVSLPFLLITIGYLIIRIKVIGGINPGVKTLDFPEFPRISFSVLIFTLPTVILSYLKSIVLPISLSPVYTAVKYVYQPNLTNFYLPLLLVIILALASLILFYNSKVSRIAFIWLVLPILPALDVRAFEPEKVIQDRYLYLSLIGVGLLLAEAFYWLNTRLVLLDNNQTELKAETEGFRPSLVLSIILLFVVLMASTIKQNYIWLDEWHLWAGAKEVSPSSCLANRVLGQISFSNGLENDAIAYFEEAKEGCPNSVIILRQLGAIYGRKRDFDRAEKEFNHLAEIAPFYDIKAEAYFNLGLIYQYRGDKIKAIEYYQKASKLDPGSEWAMKANRNSKAIQ